MEENELDALLDASLDDFERGEQEEEKVVLEESKEEEKEEKDVEKLFMDEFKKSLETMGLDQDLDDEKVKEAAAEFEKLLQDSLAEMKGDGSESPREGNEEAFVDSFLQDILSKNVLYEPLLDMQKAYPSWLEDNAEKISAEDLGRYRKQQVVVGRICAAYEEDAPFGEVEKLMEEMSNLGNPPPDMLQTLAPGMENFADGGNCLLM